MKVLVRTGAAMLLAFSGAASADYYQYTVVIDPLTMYAPYWPGGQVSFTNGTFTFDSSYLYDGSALLQGYIAPNSPIVLNGQTIGPLGMLAGTPNLFSLAINVNPVAPDPTPGGFAELGVRTGALGALALGTTYALSVNECAYVTGTEISCGAATSTFGIGTLEITEFPGTFACHDGSGAVIGCPTETPPNSITASVPEPATWALMGLGLAGTLLMRRRPRVG